MHQRLTRTTVLTGLAIACLAVLACCLPSTPSDAEAPLFTRTTPAENPLRLCLIRDGQKVLGWISGRDSRTGCPVVVTCGDRPLASAIVQADNTFTWHYRVDKPTDVTFTFGKQSGSLRLLPVETLEPAAFFVVDRSVYRPGQTLRFAAFLRRQDETGRFVPVAPQDVEVRLTSVKKQTVAAKLRLRSDEAGRLAGEYTFSEADALDSYELSAVGFRGAAAVALAEFRKSKIRLKIAGKVADGKLELTFDAVDFTDKHVSASRVDFNVQIVRDLPAPAREGLKGDDFVYAPAGDDARDWGEDVAAAWPDDDALLAAWQPSRLPDLGPRGPAVLAQTRHSLELAGPGQVSHRIDLRKDWLEGPCSALVEGVVTDRNGREQRAVERIDLAGTAPDRPLRLHLPERDLAAGETFRLSARLGDRPLPDGARSTAVALRLIPNPIPYGGYALHSNVAHYQLDQRFYARSLALPHRSRWHPAPDLAVAHHQFVRAVPFDGDHVELSLDESGPYRIVVSTRLPDGRVIQDQAGLVVRPSRDVPRLILRLDKRELAAGERLTGQVDSAFAGARLLLTLRDSRGVRWWQPLQLDAATGRFSLPLPPDLSYGCSLAVQYPDPLRMHVAQQTFRVRPDDRTVQVQAKVPADCRPGQKVRLDFQVNRGEPVDLVVSVYDQSLLAVAPDRRTDIRDFFLADLRAADQAAADLLRRRLGDLTVEQAVALAKAAQPSVVRDEHDGLLQAAASVRPGQNINTYHLVGLLEAAGIAVRCDINRWGSSWYAQVSADKQSPCRLVDLLDVKTTDGTFLRFHLRGEVFLLDQCNPRRLAEAARNLARYGGDARYLARGDAHFSAGANAMYSVSGQSFISHLPAEPAIELIQPDASVAQVSVRTDFSDSAYWNATLRTGADGRASVEFKLPDSITNWHVVATAVSKDMHVGQHKASFRSTRPIMVWPMIPRVFTEGDRVRLFAAVHNTTDQDQTLRVRLKVDNGSVLDEEEKLVRVAARSDAPVYWTFEPGKAGFTQLLMTATCPAGSDASLKRLPVVCPAAEELITRSGYCKAGAELDVPADVDLAKASLDVVVVPSLAADMVDTLEYLVEYPHGCVEQTMSRFLPAIKVAQILKRYGIEHPGLMAKLPGCVDAGIKRLLQLQQADGGWGWQGSGQTHEMMTPYALYGLLEARAAGYVVDEQAVQRGLNRLKTFIDAMGPAQAADRIYCLYVYSLGRNVENAWWDFIEAQLDAGRLSDYALALSLEMAARKDRREPAGRLARALRGRVQESPQGLHWRTAGFSRWGEDPYEITAAVLKAFAVHDHREKLIPGILDYFARTKRGNRWNSTKDTAMILFAMCEYLARQDGSAKGGLAAFRVNDGPELCVNLAGGLCQSMRLQGAGLPLRTGRNKVVFEKTPPGTMYRLVLRHRRSGGDLAPSAVGVSVTRRLTLLDEKGQAVREVRDGESVPKGSYLLSSVTVQKADGGTMRYLLVSSPKPSSAEIIPADDKRFQAPRSNCVLREDKTAGVLFHHEQTGSVHDACVFLVEMAGQYVLPPAQAELMYDSDVRGHSGTFRLKVTDEQPAKVASATK